MSLNVGMLWVNTEDRDSVVRLIQEYWTGLGARPITTDPLQVEPLSLEKTGRLAFAVLPPAAAFAVDEADSPPVWTTVYDSERYTADSELAAHLAEAMGVAVIVAEFSGSVDIATIEAFGVGAPDVPRSGKEKHWDAVEDFVDTHLPNPFIYFNQLQESDPAEFADWTVFGFEGVPYRKRAQYSGPSSSELADQAVLAEAKTRASAGDAAGVREVWQSAPHLRDTIVNELDRDPGDAAARRVYLEFAEEILTRDHYWLTYPLAEAAYRAGDLALFDRAAMSLGVMVSRLEQFGVGLIHAGDADGAVRVLAAVCAGGESGITAWNNLAHALIFHNEPMPSDARAWLTGAEAHGAANPYVYHNSACAWLRLGDRDSALAAVEAAVRAGYPNLDDMRVDDDLQELHDDPRFQDAFSMTFAAGIDDLTVTVPYHDQVRDVARPLIAMHFYVEPPVGTSAGPYLAAIRQAYLADVPAGRLTTRRFSGGWGKPLTDKRIAKDDQRLRTASPTGTRTMAYRGDTDERGGAPTPYGLDIELNGDDADIPDYRPVSHVRLLFPATECLADPEAVVRRFLRYAELGSFAAGSCGLELVLRSSYASEIWWDTALVEERLAHVPGLEHQPGRDSAPGTAPGAAWLTLLGDDLLGRLERGLLPVDGPQWVTVAGGACLRASLYPATGADRSDLGAIPSVARWLRPLRDHSSADHYARFDDIPDGPFGNRPPF